MITIGLLGLAFGLIGQCLLGAAIAKAVLSLPCSVFRKTRSINGSELPSPQSTPQPERTIPIAELAGLGCILGVGVIAWSLFVWSFYSGELGILPSGVLALLGFALEGTILVTLWRRRQAKQSPRSSACDAERQEQAVCRTCQVSIAFLFVTTILQMLQTPQKLWDERAIFALKARVLFEDRSIRSPALLHPDFVQYHPRYPLLLPLAEQNIYALLGSIDDRLSKFPFALLYCGLVLTTAGCLQRHVSRGRAWLGGLLMATVPVLMPYEYGFICGQADAPTACYHGLSVLYLWDSLTRQRRQQSCLGSMLMAGICGGLAAFTKDEGIAYLGIDGTILVLFVFGSIKRLDQFRRSFLGTFLYIAAASTVLLPWFVHRRSLPNTTEMNYFGRMTAELFVARLDTLRWSVPHLIHRMFWEWREWGLQWWLMLAAFVSWPSRTFQPPQLLFVLDIAGALVALLIAGMLAPAQLDEHIGGSSHRFLMQIAPVAILFAVTIFSDNELQNSGEAS